MTRTRLDRTREHLLSCHLDLAASAFQLRLRTLAHPHELRYDPAQPRHPAGTPEGGQWSDGGTIAVAEGEAIGRSDPRDEILANSTKLVDPQGNPIKNIDGNDILYPNEMPPEFFIQRGEEAHDRLSNLHIDDPNAEPLDLFMNGVDGLRRDLYKFRQGGAWDCQRLSGSFVDEHRDYSTVAIGLYSASAGVPEVVILNIENIYAKYFSIFGNRELMSSDYKYLPIRNVYNTRIGYELYRRWR